MAVNGISPPNSPIDRDGKITLNQSWYRFFVSLRKGASDAASGEVQTDAGSGLTGGGFVADGLDLAVEPGGITNAMIRDALGCSVVGRFGNSTGGVADIVATNNGMALTRDSNIVAFRASINGVSIGTGTAAPTVRADVLSLTDAAAASTATVSHSVPVTVDGVVYYMLLSATP